MCARCVGFTTTKTTEMQKQQQNNHHATTSAAAAAAAAARKDALTRKPLDLEEEDEARKFETSKWLESHFGSESRSSHGSLEDEEHHEKKHLSTNTSYINVTMKSVPTTTAREHYKQTTTTTTTTKQQRRTTTNGATSPSGYFQGISQWSERYQSTGAFLLILILFYIFFFSFWRTNIFYGRLQNTIFFSPLLYKNDTVTRRKKRVGFFNFLIIYLFCLIIATNHAYKRLLCINNQR